MRAFGIVGRQGSGKTHLVERLITHFVAHGRSVSSVKHTHHHDVDIDRPGKDSFRHRAAGAREVILASDHRWALMRETPRGPVGLDLLLTRLEPVDVVLVEGFKGLDSLPRLEVYRAAVSAEPPLATTGFDAVGIATDLPPDRLRVLVSRKLPVLELDDTAAIAAFLLRIPSNPTPRGA